MGNKTAVSVLVVCSAILLLMNFASDVYKFAHNGNVSVGELSVPIPQGYDVAYTCSAKRIVLSGGIFPMPWINKCAAELVEPVAVLANGKPGQLIIINRLGIRETNRINSILTCKAAPCEWRSEWQRVSIGGEEMLRVDYQEPGFGVCFFSYMNSVEVCATDPAAHPFVRREHA
jgi:hypothetical protein